MKSFREQSYYELLELPVTATPAQVDAAHQAAVMLYAADGLALYSLVGEEESAALRAQLDLAREVLTAPERRAEYDRSIGVETVAATGLAVVEVEVGPAAPEPVPSAAVVEPAAAEPTSIAPGVEPTALVVEPAAAEPSVEPAAGAVAEPAPPAGVESVPPAALAESASAPEATAEPLSEPPPANATSVQEAVVPSPPAPATVAAAALVSAAAASGPSSGVVPVPDEGGAAARAREPRRSPEFGPSTEFNGELLRQLREARGLTLQNLADRTRISRSHLENVEADRYKLLPPTVYLRGILTSLAKELKVEPQWVCRSYLALAAGQGKV